MTTMEDSLKDLNKELEDYKSYVLPFHVIAVIALLFLLVDLVIWMMAMSRVRKVERQVNNYKYPDTPRNTDTAEKYR